LEAIIVGEKIFLRREVLGQKNNSISGEEAKG
jgi:hypothetical protein